MGSKAICICSIILPTLLLSICDANHPSLCRCEAKILHSRNLHSIPQHLNFTHTQRHKPQHLHNHRPRIQERASPCPAPLRRHQRHRLLRPQPELRRRRRRRVVVDASGLPWEEAFGRVSRGSGVEVVVEVATGYMLRRCDEDSCYYTEVKAVAVAADSVVDQDGSGVEVSKTATRLKKKVSV
ncbi:hypothetical protein AAHA92_14921 [Salvia divinorum]|uniref:Uncharacterized protein n=1 Tax=Salvia divinorum TaxID=28513 RepID=A0ABD1HDU5_SALDI